ncbi:hypothetical protein QWI29_22245 [Mycolicibacterium neoaurum]|uniref:hypothetical protein n=1 Tax=Mycolicibacterium neoaurum TaxID=1795 RepID=UPI0026711977|nr:hypothetical protein [Mycolicibacterium neoaurum]MDO3402771.1 hypothetical protein [Mycolicibacterium neoaurum]
MLPPPPPTWPADRVAQFYVENGTGIKIGATILSWSSAFMVPLAIVVAIQMSRHERGKPVWSILSGAGGVMMSIFLVLPPLFWGVAAFTPTRAPEITATMHELALLTLVTTDQYFVFMWVAVTVVCLIPNKVVHSPFPRWFGYLTAWIAIMFEAGAIAFLTRTGPFAWDGLLVFWSPLSLFGVWIIVMAVLLFKALNGQAAAAPSDRDALEPVT